MPSLPTELRRLLHYHPGWWGLLAALALVGIGIMAIATVAPELAAAQGIRWLPIALVAAAVCFLPHPRVLGLTSYAIAAASLALLLVLLLPFMPRAIVPVIHGARRWIDLQFMLAQPSELAKVALVLALAWYLRYRESYRTLRGLLVPWLIVMVPLALVVKQPDLGTAMIFLPTVGAMLVAAGARLRHLGALASVGVIVIGANVSLVYFDAPQSMRVLRPHQEARIAAMLWPERHRDRGAYQQHVATMLVGAGGVTGLGEERSRTLLRFNHLPEAHNDMIFAVIANRWGLVGCGIVIALYIVIVLSACAVAGRSRDPFAKLVCVGFAAMIFAQAAIHMGITVGLLPVTGLTLPFVSYGGSSLVATFAMVGLILNFASRRPTPLARASFEFDTRATAEPARA
ncbi:MAG: FtsW/RodA/SpoVE family cell cycle protein [Phycisphaeraceae bacterium]